MSDITHKDRVLASLNNELASPLPYCDSLWGETARRYREEGSLREKEDPTVHFDMSTRGFWRLEKTADLDFEPVVLEETDETILKLDGNGAQLRYWKNKSGTPEHVDFTVKDRAKWEEMIKPHLVNFDPRRISPEAYTEAKAKANEEQRAFCACTLAPFEYMHPVCGHEYMLMGMALDPDWVKDMVNTFVDFTIMHMEKLFEEGGNPDFMWVYEDMGFKERPFMSPDMYMDIVQPGHAKMFDWFHSHDLKVMVHSCGFVAPLVPGLIAAGMDCLQAMEVKAGMNLPQLAEEFGDQIAFCGGVDIREIASNDRDRIDAELRAKVGPVLKKGCGYILHSDHSIPPEVDHDTLEYFFQHGSKIAEWL